MAGFLMDERWRKRLWFGYLTALFTWGILVYGWLGGQLLGGTLFARQINGRPCISDFVNVYNAAILTRQCLTSPVNIYDRQVQSQSVEKLVAPIKPELPFYLQYPPYFFVIVSPLSLFPLPEAWLAWSAAGLALIVSSLPFLGTSTLTGGFSRFFFFVSLFAAFPTWLTFELGQTTFLILPALAAFFHLAAGGRYFAAGLATAIILIKLQYAPVVVAVGLILGRFKYLGGCLAGGAALLALSVAMLGPANVLNYPHALLSGETSQAVSGVSAPEMQNLRGFLCLVTGSDGSIVRYVSFAAMLICAIFTAWLWSAHLAHLKGGNGSVFKVLSSVSVLLMLAFSAHTHVQDYLLAMIPCLWLWQWAQEASGVSARARWIKGLIITLPGLSWIYFMLRPLFAMLFIEPYFLFALALSTLSIVELFHRGGISTKEPPLPDKT